MTDYKAIVGGGHDVLGRRAACVQDLFCFFILVVRCPYVFGTTKGSLGVVTSSELASISTVLLDRGFRVWASC